MTSSIGNNVTMDGRFQQIRGLFQRRNAISLRGDMMTFFVLNSLRNYSKIVRRVGASKEDKVKSLASISARVLGFTDAFPDLPILDAFTQKFGHGYCIYCRKCPCDCSKKRGVKPPPPPRIEVRNWTFPEAIAEIGRIYGMKNRVDGVPYLADRLREEFSEVTDVLLLDIHKPGIKVSTHWWNLACEVADVYSVICAIADQEELDLDTEIHNRYGGVHARCGCRPCECEPFYQYMTDHAETVTT